MASGKKIRIGTRGSPLALAQAHETRERLMHAHNRPQSEFDIVVIKTSGDKILDRALSVAGGKGLFTKEIEEALLDEEIDMAVHSAKDMPTQLPARLGLTCWLPRQDVRDAFISGICQTFEGLPSGSLVGTASLRRQAMILNKRPDLRVELLRGNVQTRLRRIDEKVVDATFLAIAGLNRLEMAHVATAILSIEEFLPAVGQGSIAIETRLDDMRIRDYLSEINDLETERCVACERAFLAGLDGSCRTPIAGYASVAGGQLRLRGQLLRPDGSEVLSADETGLITDAEELGAAMADDFLSRGGGDFY